MRMRQNCCHSVKQIIVLCMNAHKGQHQRNEFKEKGNDFVM